MGSEMCVLLLGASARADKTVHLHADIDMCANSRTDLLRLAEAADAIRGCLAV
jgi:hypothetical protein